MPQQHATIELEPPAAGTGVEDDAAAGAPEGPEACTCPDWCALDHAN